MKRILLLIFFVAFSLFNLCYGQLLKPLNPPAVPLVLSDPYFSCWSFGSDLTADDTRHWTGQENEMHGLIRVDGNVFSFLGKDKVKNAEQTSVVVNPTQSIYTFKCDAINLTLTFTSPLLLTELDVLSRPVTYVTFDMKANDKKDHEVQIYFDVAGDWTVNESKQLVQWKRVSANGLEAMRIGSVSQEILSRQGDDLRIDWGYLYLAPEKNPKVKTVISYNAQSQKLFLESGTIPSSDDSNMPRAADDQTPSMAVLYNIGEIDTIGQSYHLMIAYDDIYAVEYFHKKLRAWWRRSDSTTVEKMLAAANREYKMLFDKCVNFDKQLMGEASRAGGEEYAAICALSYRQAIAAHKLVADSAGRPLFFSKENFSNGSIGTVDVTYPSAPLFLLYNPSLVKAMMDPIFYYSESGRWTKPFPAHDLGTYPRANGQTYPEDMPVEECGNMLILVAAIAEVEKSPAYAKKHWKVLSQWKDYLKKDGFDCANQLCTDDFAGHLARNTNLSIKTIVALASYGKLAGQLGYKEEEEECKGFAAALTRKWIESADAGDHYSLAFERRGTWSLKYNLVWDQLLDLNLFPDEVVSKELAYYQKMQNKFGVPLDNRNTYTKSDWIMWTATLAKSQVDFQNFIHPIYLYINESPDRIPLNDWHETTNGKAIGFRARSVVGGYFIKILDERLKDTNEEVRK